MSKFTLEELTQRDRLSMLERSFLDSQCWDSQCLPPRGYTPLYHAAFVGILDGAKILLKAGAQVNKPSTDGGTPLHAAIMGGNVAMAELLLTHGADVNASDKYGLTPLRYAIGLFAHDTTTLNLIIKTLLKSPDTITNLTYVEKICVMQVLKDNLLYVSAQNIFGSELEVNLHNKFCSEIREIFDEQHLVPILYAFYDESLAQFCSELEDIVGEQRLVPILYAFYMDKPHVLESVPFAGAAAAASD